MLLTITTTRAPATDLGFLLVKHPDRMQSFSTTGGMAHVFYPEATVERCTAALLLEVDPIELARPAKGQLAFALGRYVNDRPYVASSLLAVALGKVFRSALRGISRDRADLAETAIPLEIEVPALPCRGGASIAERLFAPLGWSVETTAVQLDSVFPDWGDSPYERLRLTGTLRLADALNHLYVLLPVLDDAKHYWVSADEVDKLLRAGDGWLGMHPERELITNRYLAGRRTLAQTALERLRAVDDAVTDDEMADDAVVADDAAAVDDSTAVHAATADGPVAGEAAPADGAVAVNDSRVSAAAAAVSADAAARIDAAEKRKPLVKHRKEAVLAALAESGAARVLDLGCGSGALLKELMADQRYTTIVGADVSSVSLAIAERRLKFARLPDRQRARITLIQSALTYHDDRLRGYDAAVLMEVIEHVDEPRLPALERAVFGHAAPGAVIVTTPNVEYNVRYSTLDGHRHDDHRFEWTRAEFAAWAARIAETFGYTVDLRPVGDLDPEAGAPTQLAFFRKAAASEPEREGAVTSAPSLGPAWSRSATASGPEREGA